MALNGWLRGQIEDRVGRSHPSAGHPPRCVVRLIELPPPPHFVIALRPRGVAVATTAAPETRLADLHARGNTRPPLSLRAGLFPRISSNCSLLFRDHHPQPLGSIYTRFNLAVSPPLLRGSSRWSDSMLFCRVGRRRVVVRKNRIKDVPTSLDDLCDLEEYAIRKCWISSFHALRIFIFRILTRIENGISTLAFLCIQFHGEVCFDKKIKSKKCSMNILTLYIFICISSL